MCKCNKQEESVKIIGKGSGGLPAHLTGFNDQSSTDGSSSSSSSSSSSINTVTEKVSQFPTEKQNNPFSFLAASGIYTLLPIYIN